MSRLIVVSNRVAPITEGEPTAGGLAAGVMDALRQSLDRVSTGKIKAAKAVIEKPVRAAAKRRAR